MTKNIFRSYWPVLSILLALAALFAIPVSAERPVSRRDKTLAAAADAVSADVIQDGYRSPGERHKVSVSDRQLLASLKSQGGRVIADYGSFVLMEVNDAVANSLQDSAKAQVVDENNLVLLNAAKIDTSAEKPNRSAIAAKGKQMRLIQFAGPVRPEWHSALLATGARVVTYIPNNAYLVYGSAQALQKVQALASDKSVAQWDADYSAAFRLDPAVTKSAVSVDPKKNKATAAPNLSAKGNEQFTIQMVEDAAENATTLALIDQLKLEPVIKKNSVLGYVNVRVALPKAAVISQIAERPDVVSIQPWNTPQKRDERQDIILTGNVSGSPAVPTPMDYLAYLTGKGFNVTTTAGFAVNLTDSGVDNATTTPNHFGLYRIGDPTVPANSRIIYNRLVGTPHAGSTLQGCDGHGNENAHIIGGYVPTGGIFSAFPHADAAGFRWGLGLAPFVKIGSSVIFDPDTFTSPNYTTLESTAYNDGARISSNSWGSNSNAYTVDSQEYDALVRDAQPAGAPFPAAGNQEYIIIFAAGNGGSGANTVGEPSTGKNVITVGASENVNPFSGSDACGVSDAGADNANDIIGFSSRGPTSDGRKKPDIMGPGTHVSAGVAQASIVSPTGSGNGAQLACFDGTGVCGGVGSNFFPAGQQWWTASSGTSHSTPATAGAAALIRQYFINQSLTPPSPAMTKALLLNSARYMNGAGANDSLPSNNQGMGEINLNSFFDIFATANSRHDELAADTFTASGQQRVITGTVSNNSKPLRITIAWTDVPGPTSGNAFVNNLDLEVTAGGNTYKGNVFTGAFSTTGGTADTRNNVESVFIPAGVTGSLVIKVKATNIAGDGVPNNAAPLDQDYALVAYNVTEAPLPVVSSGATALTAESCGPANGAIDPGETVTVNLDLSNVGTANTSSLVATLQATGGVTSPSGPQNYGVVVAGGPAVTRPFTFTAGTTCGQTITATLQLQDGATNLGNVTFTFLTGALGGPLTATYSSGNIATAIPDQGTVDIPIVISDSGVVSDINVKVRLDHTYDADLQISLVSPGGGITIPLSSGRGGSGDNFGSGSNNCSGTHTVFDDAAATAISAGSAPFTGSFKPESPLTGFNGVLVAGTWTLHIADTAGQDTGTVGCVQLEITRQQFVCCGVAGVPIVVAAPPAVIAAESAFPANSVPDPGETVTVNFPLLNNGTGNTSNLVATLQNSGGVTPITTSQNYGVVVAAGPTVSRPFTFVANGSCAGTITATLHLQDGVTDLGNVTYTMQLGTTSTVTQTFTNATPIIIPASGTGATTGAPASPYPSTIAVSGVANPSPKVTVTLSNINHTFPGDIDVLLVSPTGRKFILMADVIGDPNATGQTYTLDDDAAALLPAASAPASGAFKPTNYTPADPDLFPVPAPTGPYLSPAPTGTDTLASAFTGVAGGNPNGNWSLYVVDDANVDVGNFNGGWSITFTSTTPVCASPVLAASVKTHGGFGSFPVDLPLVGTTGIECRTTGGTNDYQMVITFAAGGYSVTGGPQAQVISGSATVGTGGVANGGAVSFNGPGQVCTVPLTNVTNGQTINVRLNNVSDGTNVGNIVIPMSILIGDVNASASVTGVDVNLCKTQVGVPTITSSNFRTDVNATGSVTGPDVNAIKAQVGTFLP
jgi:subtilisin-like proprotein convertase family protein